MLLLNGFTRPLYSKVGYRWEHIKLGVFQALVERLSEEDEIEKGIKNNDNF
jgi:hypothetical protein